MRLIHKAIALTLSAAAVALPLTGCAGGGVFYDPYRHDYHQWSHGEDRYYRQWESSTHRSHMDFQRRSPEDQHSYWGWRHR